MNSRSGPPSPDETRVARLLPWVVVAVAVIVGVALAFRFGSRVTPLIDALR